MKEVDKQYQIQREAFNMRVKHGNDAANQCYSLAKEQDSQITITYDSEKEQALMEKRNYWLAVADLLKDSSLPPQ